MFPTYEGAVRKIVEQVEQVLVHGAGMNATERAEREEEKRLLLGLPPKK